MNYINITKPNRDIITLGCIHEADSNVFTFEKDIEINGWIINKTIIHGGPKRTTLRGDIVRAEYKNSPSADGRRVQ